MNDAIKKLLDVLAEPPEITQEGGRHDRPYIVDWDPKKEAILEAVREVMLAEAMVGVACVPESERLENCVPIRDCERCWKAEIERELGNQSSAPSTYSSS